MVAVSTVLKEAEPSHLYGKSDVTAKMTASKIAFASRGPIFLKLRRRETIS